MYMIHNVSTVYSPNWLGVKYIKTNILSRIKYFPEEFEAAIVKALEVGYRHFDIAYAYGNELNLGNVLSRWISAGKIKREDLFITSKPSCSWSGKAPVSKPVATCAKNGIDILTDVNAVSGCDGGGAFVCNNQQPIVVNDNLAYGFAAAVISGQSEYNSCCACYELTFTSGPVSGKKMVVQVTNTGSDLGENHFDLQIPGGGVGIFNGCKPQWGAPDNGWGQKYGGVSSLAECDQLPSQIRAGCQFRFGWFKGADNPTVSFVPVTCPAQITSRTGCIRTA